MESFSARSDRGAALRIAQAYSDNHLQCLARLLGLKKRAEAADILGRFFSPGSILDNDKARILVVEDCPDTRQMIKFALKQSGCKQVFEAADGKEALNLLGRQPVDLIISDWRMPKMDGLTLFDACRESPRTRRIPFLMLTAESAKDSVVEAIEAGVTDYLLKPFTLHALSLRVKKLLNDPDGDGPPLADT